jgi:hypothetical protein
MKAPRLAAIGVAIAAVILLIKVCYTAPPTNRSAENRNNTASTETFPTVPRPTTDPQCDPNYSGCVPIASDVDCAGGRGNGPAYVQGPVRVIGRDIYKLDRDGDGIGCEN